MASDFRETMCTVFYCPHGERATKTNEATKFRLTPTTTFFDLLEAACFYYQRPRDEMVLRNQNSAIWPMRKYVSDEIRKGEVVIRLAPCDQGEEEEVVEQVVVEEVVEVAKEDDGRVVSARPPLYRELFLHFFFLAILLTDTYAADTTPTFAVHSALEAAFITPRNQRPAAVGTRSLPHLRSDDFRKISTMEHACDWLQLRLADGLFRTDLLDTWGSVSLFNRVAGGVTIRTDYQRWVSEVEAYDLGADGTELPERSSLDSRVAPVQLSIGGDEPGRLSKRNYTIIAEDEVAGLTNAVCSWQPDALNSTEGPAEQVLRGLKLSMLLFNRNTNQFFSTTFLFDQRPSGEVKPYYSFRPFNLEPAWGSWPLGVSAAELLRRARFWLAVVNYLLVAMRTLNELKACRRVSREKGSILPYLGGVYTLLELFNLTCNYVGLGFRILQMASPQRVALERLIREHETHTAEIETAVESVVLYEGVVVTARALSIISAMLLLFKYLELAPRRYLPSCYLSGTTISRAGRDLQVVAACMLVMLLTFSVIGEQIFGPAVADFSSVPTAFFTLTKMVAGSGIAYRTLRDDFPLAGPLFFVAFTLTHLLLLTPLFLATLNDAYAVRHEQMRQAAERRAAREAKKKEKEAEIRRRLAAAH
jgi:hypothetical protein